MSAHTPGPWHVEAGCIWAEAEDGAAFNIATPHAVLMHVSMAERNANARLIAAAPDLLAACNEVCRVIAFTPPAHLEAELKDAYDKCRAAIVKAEAAA